jgi:hypothetical protein
VALPVRCGFTLPSNPKKRKRPSTLSTQSTVHPHPFFFPTVRAVGKPALNARAPPLFPQSSRIHSPDLEILAARKRIALQTTSPEFLLFLAPYGGYCLLKIDILSKNKSSPPAAANLVCAGARSVLAGESRANMSRSADSAQNSAFLPCFPPSRKQRDEYNQGEQTQPFPLAGKMVE